MADIYTDQIDEQLISDVLHYGFKTKTAPKLRVLRLALAKSLQITTPPNSDFDKIPEKGSEYSLKQVTGRDSENDLDDSVRAMLSIYHEDDFFNKEKDYRKHLQRHIRRGLKEIRTSWARGHDFSSYLEHELLPNLTIDDDLERNTLSNQNLIDSLEEIGVNGWINERVEGSRISRFFLYFENANDYDQLKKGLGKLAMLLGLGDKGVLMQPTNQPRIISLDVPREQSSWKTIQASSFWDWTKTDEIKKYVLPIWLGQDVIGGNYSFDLQEAPHILVSGTTGSGKSVCLHSIILSLLATLPRGDIELALIDPKRVEFVRYESTSQLYEGGVVYLVDQAANLLEELVDEMERRHQLMYEANVTNLSEGRGQNKINLPYIVVVIEELADLLMQSSDIETPLVRLAQKARSCGIHLVLATQRPDSTILTGLLRSNIPGRIALRVQKHTESNIILDEKGAEALLGRGDMLVKIPPDIAPKRVHGAKLTQDDLEQIKHV
jgi:S-DNA-T family DNA segregation ATPase FtsK/SpoIIIE